MCCGSPPAARRGSCHHTHKACVLAQRSLCAPSRKRKRDFITHTMRAGWRRVRRSDREEKAGLLRSVPKNHPGRPDRVGVNANMNDGDRRGRSGGVGRPGTLQDCRAMRGDGFPLPVLFDEGVGENYLGGKRLAFEVSNLRGGANHNCRVTVNVHLHV
jgi:hypothetical protein